MTSVDGSWEASGCADLTAPGVPTPTRLVRGVHQLIESLDARGAGLADEFPGGGLGVLAQRAQLLGLAPSGRASCGGLTRLFYTVDGEVAVSLARSSDVELLPAWAGLLGAGDFRAAPSWDRVGEIVSGRSMAALVAAATELGLPCAAVGEVTDRRPSIVTQLGDASPRAVVGARVVNLGSLWAAPLAAHVLARMGADVVTIESTSRLDGARATPAFFGALRAGVRGLTLDFGSAAGRGELLRRITEADIVIEGSRPRALSQLGVSAERNVTDGHPQVWLSITGYGRAEADGMRVGFGDDTAAAGGLLGRTPTGTTVFLADAIGDPLTGLTAAAAAADLLERGGSYLADVALARVCAGSASF